MLRDDESLIDIERAAQRILRYANGVRRNDLEEMMRRFPRAIADPAFARTAFETVVAS
jgi:hypothetical protein